MSNHSNRREFLIIIETIEDIEALRAPDEIATRLTAKCLDPQEADMLMECAKQYQNQLAPTVKQVKLLQFKTWVVILLALIGFVAACALYLVFIGGVGSAVIEGGRGVHVGFGALKGIGLIGISVLAIYFKVIQPRWAYLESLAQHDSVSKILRKEFTAKFGHQT